MVNKEDFFSNTFRQENRVNISFNHRAQMTARQALGRGSQHPDAKKPQGSEAQTTIAEELNERSDRRSDRLASGA